MVMVFWIEAIIVKTGNPSQQDSDGDSLETCAIRSRVSVLLRWVVSLSVGPKAAASHEEVVRSRNERFVLESKSPCGTLVALL